MPAKKMTGRSPAPDEGQQGIHESFIEQIARQILLRARELPADGSMTWRAMQEWHPGKRKDADAAIAYAMDAGWLVESDGALRLTQAGMEISRRKLPSFHRRRKI